MLTVSAPGKLMLMGEHAVVHGIPCLVTAVDQRLRVSIEKTAGPGIEIYAPQAKNTKFVEAAIAKARQTWDLPDSGIKITTNCDFSSSYGLGSSSAVTVAVIKAVATLFGKDIDSKTLFEKAYEVVLEIQGTGSGFDVASASYGGTILYVKGGTTLEPLETKQPIPLVVGYTGIKADTTTLINAVAEKKKQFPEKVDRIFEAIGKLVLEGEQKFLEGDWERLGKLFDFNQEYLRDLGVSSEKLEALISAAKGAGAWGAKLSGAGGGDCMIALVSPDKRGAVEEAIAEAGGEIVRALPHAEGIRIETSDNQQELFVVVDEHDNIVDYKTRYECHHDKSLIHRAIGLLIFDRDGRVLLQKRSRTKDTDPGVWADSVGGHVMKGETYEEAVRREMKEELGIEAPAQLHSKFLLAYPNESEINALFTATCEGPFHPDPTEVETVAFVHKNELPRKLLSGEMKLTQFAQEALRKVGYL